MRLSLNVQGSWQSPNTVSTLVHGQVNNISENKRTNHEYVTLTLTSEMSLRHSLS